MIVSCDCIYFNWAFDSDTYRVPKYIISGYTVIVTSVILTILMPLVCSKPLIQVKHSLPHYTD